MSSIWTVRRSTTDTKLAGLAGGVAEHWGIDPVLVRVGWVLLALSGGVGLVLYVAGWLLIPLQGRATAPVDDLLGDTARRWSKEVWLTLVVVACLAAFAVFGSMSPFGVGPAVIIACIWYFGFYKQRQGQDTASSPEGAPVPSVPAVPAFVTHPGPATPFTDAADAWRRRIEEHVRLSAPVAATPARVEPAPTWPSPPSTPAPADLQDPDPEREARSAFLATPDPVGLYVEEPVAARAVPVAPRRRGDRPAARRLRLLTLLVLGLTTGGLALAERQGVEIAASAYAAAALLVVGLALVAATWFGRARGLLALGLLLVPVVVLTSVVGPLTPLDQWSQNELAYRTVAELPPAGDSQPAGELQVDLRGLDLDADATYAAHLGMGRLEVTVPADVNVELRYRVEQGLVLAFDEDPRAGTDLSQVVPPAAPLLGRPTLTLDLSVDRGQLEIRR